MESIDDDWQESEEILKKIPVEICSKVFKGIQWEQKGKPPIQRLAAKNGRKLLQYSLQNLVFKK